MAKTSTPKTAGPARRLGPLPVWGWAAVGGGTYLVWHLYRAHAANVAAANSAPASTATTDGGTYPAVTQVPTSTLTTSAPSAPSLDAWKNSLIGNLTSAGKLSPQVAFATLNDWLNGRAVPSVAAATALQNALNTIGYDAGVGYRPVIAPSFTATTTTTHTPSEKPVGGGGTVRPAVVAKPVAVNPFAGRRPNPFAPNGKRYQGPSTPQYGFPKPKAKTKNSGFSLPFFPAI